MRFIKARDRRLGEQMIMQAHTAASLYVAAKAGKLDPVEKYLPKPEDETGSDHDPDSDFL